MRAVNLLPTQTKSSRKAPGLVGQLALVAPFVVAGLLAAGYLLAGTDENSNRATLEALKQELNAIPVPVQRPQQNAALASEKSLRIATLSATLQSRLVWDRVLRQVSAVLPGDVWLTTLSATAAQAPAAVAAPTPVTPGATTTTTTTTTTATDTTATTPPPPPPPAPIGGALALAGYTYSQEGVARLLSRLQVVSSLQSVALVSSSKTSVAGQDVVAFSITAVVRAQESG